MAALAPGTKRHFWRYCVVGAVAAVLHFAVLAGLVEIFDVVPIIGSAAGFCAAVVLNYILQYYWTFAASGSHLQKFPRFALNATLALFINLAIFWLCNVAAEFPYLLSQVAATATVVIVNFELNRRFVFAESRAR